MNAMIALLLLGLLALATSAVEVNLDKHMRISKNKMAAAAPTTAAPATPMPTFPPPKFHGYIVLAQYECMDLLCPDWSLTVTRLATECFTWNCTHEEKIKLTLVPTSPIAQMSFPVYTSYHSASRTYYVAGITGVPEYTGHLWTVHLDNNFSAFTLQESARFTFPSRSAQFASLESNSANGNAIAIWTDGTIMEINATTGVTTTKLNALQGNTSRVLTQATEVDPDNNLLFVNFNNLQGNDIGFVTVSLTDYSITSSVLMSQLSQDALSPIIFAMNWIPEISNLVVFATGNWDQLIYVDPLSGFASFAVFEIDEIMDKAQFCNIAAVKVCDTCKNTAYDRNSKILYFTATIGHCDTGTDSMLMTPAFTQGQPQPIYYLDTALSPIDFGYQGMHWVGCHPNCPT